MKLATLIAVAGIASVASAQTMTMSWTYENDVNGNGAQNLSAGETGTAYLWASWDTDVVGFAGSIFDLLHDGPSSNYAIEINPLFNLGNNGTDDGMGTITAVETFQLPPFFNPNFLADNPIHIATFTYTPDAYTNHIVNFTTANHVNFDVYTDDFGTSEGYAGDVQGDAFFNVVPAPASMALLGLGGLVATRRRR